MLLRGLRTNNGVDQPYVISSDMISLMDKLSKSNDDAPEFEYDLYIICIYFKIIQMIHDLFRHGLNHLIYTLKKTVHTSSWTGAEVEKKVQHLNLNSSCFVMISRTN